MYEPIRSEIKLQILERIKEGNVPVARIAREHGVNPKTVYGWIERTVLNQSSLVELNRVKRENLGLYQLIGKLTSELDKSKRGR